MGSRVGAFLRAGYAWQLVALGVLMTAAVPAHAHEHWVDVNGDRSATGGTVRVVVASGHYFPDSSFALQDKVLQVVEWVLPDGESRRVDTTVADKQRTGTVVVTSAGVHIVRVVLKRPRAKEPSYEAKTIWMAGDGTNDVGRHSVGRGLELSPLRSLTGLARGEELPLVLLLNGQRVAGSLVATPEDGKSEYLKTETDRPALLSLTRSGRYLVTAYVNGRGCSLMFRVPARAGEKP